MYNCGPLSRVQASKAGSPRRASGAKNDFWGVPVSEVSAHRPEDSPDGVQRQFLLVLGCLKASFGHPKTWIPFNTSVKNQAFKVFSSKTPLGRTFATFWSGWSCLWRAFRKPFGGPLATLMGDPVSKIRLVRASGGVAVFFCCRMASREPLRSHLDPPFGCSEWYFQCF